MCELFNRIWTRPRYGAAFLVIIFFMVMFVWRMVDIVSFTENINGFLRDIATLFRYFLTIALMVAGVMIMFGWRPFKQKNNGTHK